jgi:hypothetical protein
MSENDPKRCAALSRIILALIVTSVFISMAVWQDARAESITYAFTGTVTYTRFQDGFPMGQSIEGSFTVGPTRTAPSSGGGFGLYYGAVTALEFSNGLSPTSADRFNGFGYSPKLGDLAIYNSPPGSMWPGTSVPQPDEYSFNVGAAHTLYGAGGLMGSRSLYTPMEQPAQFSTEFWNVKNFELVLVDDSGRAFNSAAIPTQLNFDDFNKRTFRINFDSGFSGSDSVLGTLTSLTVVPEPSAVFLLTSGLVALGVRRWSTALRERNRSIAEASRTVTVA